jgi:hypothetical protein
VLLHNLVIELIVFIVRWEMIDYLNTARNYAESVISTPKIVRSLETDCLAAIACALIALVERLDKVIVDRNGFKAVQVRQEK